MYRCDVSLRRLFHGSLGDSVHLVSKCLPSALWMRHCQGCWGWSSERNKPNRALSESTDANRDGTVQHHILMLTAQGKCFLRGDLGRRDCSRPRLWLDPARGSLALRPTEGEAVFAQPRPVVIALFSGQEVKYFFPPSPSPFPSLLPLSFFLLRQDPTM